MRISDWSSDVCSSDLHHYLSCSSRLQQTIQIGYQFGRIGCRHARRGGAGGREGGFELLSGGCRPDQAARNESFGDFRLVVIIMLAAFGQPRHGDNPRSEEHTSELQSLMRISYAVFCLEKKKKRI